MDLFRVANKIAHFAVVNILHDIITVKDCVHAAERIDCKLNQGINDLIIYFNIDIAVTGSFIGFLMERLNRIKSNGGNLILVSTNPDIIELFKRTQVDRVVPVLSSLEAVSRFYKPAKK